MRWLVDGYNVIRRSAEWIGLERGGLEPARAALCRALGEAAIRGGDTFTVVFDGAGAGGAGLGPSGVRVVFSSARESADRVLARLARDGGTVVSSDREVREAARRAGALAVTAEDFLARLERARKEPGAGGAAPPEDKDEASDDAPRQPRKGNPRRLSKKERAKARALRRL
jgi:hypothetical protein